MKYLYGVAVQGIQEFIFRTNKLSEITGASELVERICTSYFDEVVGKKKSEDDKNLIMQAAGNVKYIFDSREKCEAVVRQFPKLVLEKVPGITISQAVVKFSTEEASQKDFLKLESLLRTQRNKADRPTTLGLMGIERSRQTGLPVVYDEKYKNADEATIAKKKVVHKTVHTLCKKAFGTDRPDKLISYDTDKMTGDNDWIAIIHADGNGLGQAVQNVAKKGSDELKNFSKKLDDANKEAAQAAFEFVQEKYNLGDENIPIRPIVLSGDDFTMICRADFALDYTKAFIENFEDKTKEKGIGIDGEGLKACGGIAFVKSSFPFYYGYEMAKSLCDAAKKDAKNMVTNQAKAPSCIMFYKVEDSFTESFEEIKRRVLTTNTDDELSYAFGPYYKDKQDARWTIEELQKKVGEISGEDKDSNALKSHIRQWLSIRFNDAAQAEQKLRRMKSTLESKESIIKELTTPVEGRVPAYDVLTLHSVQYLNTKNDKKKEA